VVARPGSNFFGSLKSESGWVSSLNHQPVVGRVESGRITRFDSSNFIYIKKLSYNSSFNPLTRGDRIGFEFVWLAKKMSRIGLAH